MNAHRPSSGAECTIDVPERNRYFHGQMLDVRHFRLETDYHNGKRWLLNRLVLGYGVVCGLGVREAEADAGDDGGEGRPAVIVEPGLAIDRWGREIVVDAATEPITVPEELLRPGQPKYAGGRGGDGHGGRRRHGGRDEEDEDRPRGGHAHLHLVLCYHECSAAPAPVLAGDCRDEEPCQPGVLRERYRLEFRPGCLPPRKAKLLLQDVVSSDGRVDYEALAKAVSEPCHCSAEPCIPLANLTFDIDPDDGHCHADEIDIAVRPIVYSNDLLFQLILSAVAEEPSYRTDK